MAFFKVSIKLSNLDNIMAVKLKKVGTTQGQEVIIAAFQRKYGLNIKPLMNGWIFYLDIKQK